MINKAFIDETVKIMAKLAERQIKFLHGNILVAKVKMDRLTAGGIIISDDYADREEFKSGFAKILALDEGYSGELKVGDYVMFSHEARYKLYTAALREILGHEVQDNFVYTVQDNNVILRVPEEVLHEKSK